MSSRAPSVVVLAAALVMVAGAGWAVVASLDGFDQQVRRASHDAVHRAAQRLALDANARAVERSGPAAPTVSEDLSWAARRLAARHHQVHLTAAPDGSRTGLAVGPSRACVRLVGGRAVATDGPCTGQ